LIAEGKDDVASFSRSLNEARQGYLAIVIPMGSAPSKTVELLEMCAANRDTHEGWPSCDPEEPELQKGRHRKFKDQKGWYRWLGRWIDRLGHSRFNQDRKNPVRVLPNSRRFIDRLGGPPRQVARFAGVKKAAIKTGSTPQ